MATNPNIIRLLEMLENPEAYSEQYIRDAVNKNEETREAYRLMVAARQGYESEKRKVESEEFPPDVEAAWQQFADKHYPQQPSRSWMKMAASFSGILFVSGIAFAAIHWWGLAPTPASKGMGSESTQFAESATKTVTPQEGTREAPVVYDNISLEKMLQEICDHYGVEMVFKSEDARGLRFHFVWNPQADLGKVVSDLNRFERLHVTLKNQQLTVE